jgi:hypothetical protein
MRDSRLSELGLVIKHDTSLQSSSIEIQAFSGLNWLSWVHFAQILLTLAAFQGIFYLQNRQADAFLETSEPLTSLEVRDTISFAFVGG